MKTKFFIPAAAVIALALGAVPVHAQHGGGGDGAGGGGHASGGARSAAVPRGWTVAGGGARTGVAVPRGSVAGPYGGRYYGGYGFGYALGSPYYAFRPRVSIGLGLYL